jgi:hypothetical protein
MPRSLILSILIHPIVRRLRLLVRRRQVRALRAAAAAAEAGELGRQMALVQLRQRFERAESDKVGDDAYLPP